MKQLSFGLIALLALFGHPALASTELPPRATVSFGDLDLRTDAGADLLRRRIDRAVVAISGGDALAPGTMIPSPDLDAARATGRRQADDLISAARHPECSLCEPDHAAARSGG